MMMNSELEGCGSVKWPKLRNYSSAWFGRTGLSHRKRSCLW